MTTQMEIQRDLKNVYQFLQTKANARGLISVPQERLAAELGMGAPKFHRMVHKLADSGMLKIAGGGRQPKTIWLIPDPKTVKKDEPLQMPPDDRTVAALKLFDALCDVMDKRKGNGQAQDT